MSESSAQFVFMTCRPGAENALKQEVARGEPAWRFAFSRPGFLTFKVEAPLPLDERRLAERRWVFAHVHGISLGKISGMQLGELTQQLWSHEGLTTLAAHDTGVADIHVWQHEVEPNSAANLADDENTAADDSPLVAEIERAIRCAAPESLGRLKKLSTTASAKAHRHPSPQRGRVLDLILLAPGEWWIGYHHAITPVERWPGGHLPTLLPAHAVSRAYAKLEEAIAWSGLPVAAGDECVEIGCAPGGACQALLDRGLFVTGIDPADVDPVLLEHSRFRHLKKRGKDVRRSEFLGVRWLVADMNIAPQATLDEIEPIVTHQGVTIRGLVLTLKLSDWNAADRLEEFAQRVRGWGYRDVRLRQLVSGGQEVCLVALRRKALRRLGRKQNRKRIPNRVQVARQKTTAGEAALAAGERRDEPHSDLPSPHF